MPFISASDRPLGGFKNMDVVIARSGFVEPNPCSDPWKILLQPSSTVAELKSGFQGTEGDIHWNEERESRALPRASREVPLW